MAIGVDDPISGEPIAARLGTEAPEAEVVRIESCGHYPQLEQPAAVVRAFDRLAERALLH
jgi:pimeloyl-ACP methyl ester carboxylesterase